MLNQKSTDIIFRASGVRGAMEWLLLHATDPEEPSNAEVVNETETNAKSTKSHSSKSRRRREFVPNRKVSVLQLFSHSYGCFGGVQTSWHKRKRDFLAQKFIAEDSANKVLL